MASFQGRKILCAAIILFCAAGAAGQPPELGQGVLLLRNGQMIEGKITHADGHYQANFADGEIRLRDADVEFYCHTLEEGYQRKRAGIQLGNAHDHLQLAQWCEQHGLYRFATDELRDAAAIEPNHPMIGVLQRRLQMAMEPPQPSAETAAHAGQGPTAEDLDRLTRGMATGSVEAFSQYVQPLLMNHCTASGCHGPQSETKFRLMRAAFNQPAGRRLTQRNLHAVLQYIDYGVPQSSRFLTAISGPHGPVRTPIFTDHQAGQYKRLVDWVNLVTRQPGGAEATASIVAGKDAMPPAHAAEDAAAPRPLSSTANRARPLLRPSREGKPGPVRAASATVAEDAAAPADPPAKLPKADPFDPEVFNRQYAPKPPAKE